MLQIQFENPCAIRLQVINAVISTCTRIKHELVQTETQENSGSGLQMGLLIKLLFIHLDKHSLCSGFMAV